MTKYSIKVKRDIIELVENKNYSIGAAAKELGISKTLAQRWLKMYEHHGYEGLAIKRRTYSGEFRISVVEYMYENHLSLQEASARYGIPSRSTLMNWERRYFKEGAIGLMTNKQSRPRKNTNKKPKSQKTSKGTEEDLIVENQRLRAENAYLKKYNALVQKKRNLEAARRRK